MNPRCSRPWSRLIPNSCLRLVLGTTARDVSAEVPTFPTGTGFAPGGTTEGHQIFVDVLTRFAEHGSPFIREIDFVDFFSYGQFFENGNLFRLRFGGDGSGRSDRRGGRCRRLRHDVRIGEARSFLISSAQLAETLGAARVSAPVVELLELRGKFGSAAIVAGAENEIEQFFESRSVLWGTAQNGFEQAHGFLR